MSEQVGKNIAAKRKELGYSAAEVERKADVAFGTVLKLEAGGGNPTIKTLEKIAEALGCTVGDLIG